jgi:hypothetical protein
VDTDIPDVDPHFSAALAIPWLVNGTLDAGQKASLQAHLAHCAQCRADYEGQLRLYESVRAGDSLAFAAEPSFQKLMARIGATEEAMAQDTAESAMQEAPRAPAPAATAPRGSPASRRRSPAVSWLAAAVVIEALCLGVGAWGWHGRSATAPAYSTLTSPETPHTGAVRVHVVFRQSLSLGRLEALLRNTGARIIDGPTDANVYTLGFDTQGATPGSIEGRIRALRADADVLFAESIGTSAPQ